MGAIRTLGRRMPRSMRGGLAVGAAVGAGLAIRDADLGKRTVNASMDFVFSDPETDNQILGRDISASNLFNFPDLVPSLAIPNMPNWMPPVLPGLPFGDLPIADSINAMSKVSKDFDTIASGGGFSKTLFGDAFMDYKDNDHYMQSQAQRNADDGYTDNPNSPSIHPYVSNVNRRGVAATGDVVLGMYNTRR